MFKNIILSLTVFSVFAGPNFAQLSAMENSSPIEIDESYSSSTLEQSNPKKRKRADSVEPKPQKRCSFCKPIFSLFSEKNSRKRKQKKIEKPSQKRIFYVQLQNGRTIKVRKKNASKHSEYFQTVLYTQLQVTLNKHCYTDFEGNYIEKNYLSFPDFEDSIVEPIIRSINKNKISHSNNMSIQNINLIEAWNFSNFIICKEILNILLPKLNILLPEMVELNYPNLPLPAGLKLKISHINGIQPTINFLRNNPNLYITSLDLSNTNITDTQLEKISDHGNFRNSLQELNLSECHQLQDFNLGNLPNLKQLYLTATNITDTQLEKILNHWKIRNSLQKLDLSWCKQLQNFNLDNLPNLKELDLSECNQLQNFNLGNIPNLKKLYLIATNITNTQLENILNHGNFRSSIQKLVLSWYDQLQNVSLGSLPNLKELNLS